MENEMFPRFKGTNERNKMNRNTYSTYYYSTGDKIYLCREKNKREREKFSLAFFCFYFRYRPGQFFRATAHKGIPNRWLDIIFGLFS